MTPEPAPVTYGPRDALSVLMNHGHRVSLRWRATAEGGREWGVLLDGEAATLRELEDRAEQYETLRERKTRRAPGQMTTADRARLARELDRARRSWHHHKVTCAECLRRLRDAPGSGPCPAGVPIRDAFLAARDGSGAGARLRSLLWLLTCCGFCTGEGGQPKGFGPWGVSVANPPRGGGSGGGHPGVGVKGGLCPPHKGRATPRHRATQPVLGVFYRGASVSPREIPALQLEW